MSEKASISIMEPLSGILKTVIDFISKHFDSFFDVSKITLNLNIDYDEEFSYFDLIFSSDKNNTIYPKILVSGGEINNLMIDYDYLKNDYTLDFNKNNIESIELFKIPHKDLNKIEIEEIGIKLKQKFKINNFFSCNTLKFNVKTELLETIKERTNYLLNKIKDELLEIVSNDCNYCGDIYGLKNKIYSLNSISDLYYLIEKDYYLQRYYQRVLNDGKTNLVDCLSLLRAIKQEIALNNIS